MMIEDAERAADAVVMNVGAAIIDAANLTNGSMITSRTRRQITRNCARVVVGGVCETVYQGCNSVQHGCNTKLAQIV